jgi:hypothetical protein
MAKWLLQTFAQGRHQVIQRSLQGLSSLEASRRLVEVLETVTAGRSGASRANP